MPTANTYNYTNVKVEPLHAPEMARTLVAKFPESKTLTRGTLLGELNARPGYYDSYDHTAIDGLQVVKGILMYNVVTDANGLITNLGGPIFASFSAEAIYYSGYFACEDVANIGELDDAIAAGYCRLIQGTSTTGIFALGL